MRLATRRNVLPTVALDSAAGERVVGCLIARLPLALADFADEGQH